MSKNFRRISLILSILLIFQWIIVPGISFYPKEFVLAEEELLNLDINFQPKSAEVPDGFIPDNGEIYGWHNGYTYGWNIDHSERTVTSDVYNLELSTSIQFQQGGIWEIELANGNYDVTVSIGDALYNSINSINVEGINYWDNITLNNGEFLQETKNVYVNDGKLTLDQGNLNEGNTRLNYIRIVERDTIVETDTTDSTLLATPINLHSQSISDNEVTLAWNPGSTTEDINGYFVYRDGLEIATVTSSVYQANLYVDKNLSPATTYIYEVAAFDSMNNKSMNSKPIYVRTLGQSSNGIGLKAEYFNGTDLIDLGFTRIDKLINFDWEGDSPDTNLEKDNFSVRWSGKVEPRYSEEYTFYTETHGGVRLWINNKLIIDDWNTTNFSTNSGSIDLIAGEKYDLKMEYREDKGSAQASLFWSSKNQDKEIVSTSQLYPPYIPNPPTNIGSTSTSTTVSLSWDEVTGITGYEIEADGVIIDNGTNTNYIHNQLTPNTQHKYRIRAKLPEIASEWSEYQTVTTKIGVPENIRIVDLDNSLQVTWDEVNGATGYELEVDGVVIKNGLSTTYVHSNLMPNTQHSYRVRAINETGESDWSNLITKTIASDIPTNIITQITSNSISIFWDEVKGATSYEIEIDGKVIDIGTNTSYVHNNLEPNTQHTYRIRALKTDVIGDWSNLIIKSTFPESGNGTGLKGEYFDNDNLSSLITTKIDEIINFDWKNKQPVPGINDKDFSVRWTGQIEPRFSETHTFYTETHGGIRVWIDNKLIIDDWDIHNHAENSGEIYLEGGRRYDIQIEYREINGIGLAKLYWESNNQTKEIIPNSQLYPLGIPQNIQTTSDETTITLTWLPVTFANGYDIEVDGVIVNNASSNVYTHTGLTPGTQHNYRVRATNGNVIGEWSASITEETLLGRTSIIGIEPTETTLAIIWEPVNGATSYDIEVDGTIVNNNNNTTFTHRDLLSGTEHSYRVRARSNYVTGEWTSLIEKWTLPDIPNNFTTYSTSNSISIEWDTVRGATGYEIEVYNTIIDNGNSITFTEDDLNPNTQRTYRVRAINSSGAGKWSPVIAKTTLPEIPKNITTTVTDTSIMVEWDPSAGATSYDLEVDGEIVSNITETSYLHSDLMPNTPHTYRVRAKTLDGFSSWSQQINEITLPSTPKNLIAIEKENEIVINWDAVLGATNYQIEVDGLIINNGNSTTYVHSNLESNTEHS